MRTMNPLLRASMLTVLLTGLLALPALADTVAVRGATVHTMAGEAIQDGVVVITDGKITAVGPVAFASCAECARATARHSSALRTTELIKRLWACNGCVDHFVGVGCHPTMSTRS